MLNRPAALNAIRRALHERAKTLRANADVAHDEATHEDSRAENKYDTRAIEAAYLAGAQARRAREAAEDAAWFDALSDVGPGAIVRGPALVVLEDEGGEAHHYFVAARAGGLRVEIGGVAVRVVTLDAPLGRALVGAEVDDDITVAVDDGRRAFVVLRVE